MGGHGQVAGLFIIQKMVFQAFVSKYLTELSLYNLSRQKKFAKKHIVKREPDCISFYFSRFNQERNR